MGFFALQTVKLSSFVIVAHPSTVSSQKRYAFPVSIGE